MPLNTTNGYNIIYTLCIGLKFEWIKGTLSIYRRQKTIFFSYQRKILKSIRMFEISVKKNKLYISINLILLYRNSLIKWNLTKYVQDIYNNCSNFCFQVYYKFSLYHWLYYIDQIISYLSNLLT